MIEWIQNESSKQQLKKLEQQNRKSFLNITKNVLGNSNRKKLRDVVVTSTLDSYKAIGYTMSLEFNFL